MKITPINFKKRVKSRNQGFLDLTAPLIEKYAYKYPSQREAWGSSLFFGDSYSFLLFSREFLNNIFLRGKRRTDSKPDIPVREALA